MSKQGLDKNSIIGLVLIGVILLVFSYVTRPSDEEVAAIKKKQLAEERAKIEQIDKTTIVSTTTNEVIDSSFVLNNELTTSGDSLKTIEQFATFGPFSNAAEGENKHFIIENE